MLSGYAQNVKRLEELKQENLKMKIKCKSCKKKLFYLEVHDFTKAMKIKCNNCGKELIYNKTQKEVERAK